MQQWEYRVINVNSIDYTYNMAIPERAEGALNQLGADGWELTGIVGNHERRELSLYLKRPKQP